MVRRASAVLGGIVDPDNPRRVGVLMDVPDMDAVMAKVQTPEGAAAMAADGVRAETLVILVEHTH